MQENRGSLKHSDWFCGYKFVKWGLGFFVFGILVGFGVLIHYLVGSRYGVSQSFLSNVTLWFGSPLSLSAGYLQIGGLGMVAVGVAKLWIARLCADTRAPSSTSDYKKHGFGSLTICNLGLILLFIVGYIGYFVIDAMYPGFYYGPIVAGKNLWLILQGISLLIYFIGLVGAFCCICKCRHCRTDRLNGRE